MSDIIPSGAISSEDLKYDTAHEALLNTLGRFVNAVPVVGSILSTEILHKASAHRMERVREVIEALERDLVELKVNVDETFVKSADFADLLHVALSQIAGERDKEKRRCYKNVLLGQIANAHNFKYNTKAYLLKLIERLSLDHLQVLQVFTQSGDPDAYCGMPYAVLGVIQSRLDSVFVAEQMDRIKFYTNGLVQEQLMDEVQYGTLMMNPEETEGYITDLGHKFLQFVKEPSA